MSVLWSGLGEGRRGTREPSGCGICRHLVVISGRGESGVSTLFHGHEGEMPDPTSNQSLYSTSTKQEQYPSRLGQTQTSPLPKESQPNLPLAPPSPESRKEERERNRVRKRERTPLEITPHSLLVPNPPFQIPLKTNVHIQHLPDMPHPQRLPPIHRQRLRRAHRVFDLPPVQIMPRQVVVVLVRQLRDGGGGRGRLEEADALDEDAEDGALGAGVEGVVAEGDVDPRLERVVKSLASLRVSQLSHSHPQHSDLRSNQPHQASNNRKRGQLTSTRFVVKNKIPWKYSSCLKKILTSAFRWISCMFRFSRNTSASSSSRIAPHAWQMSRIFCSSPSRSRESVPSSPAEAMYSGHLRSSLIPSAVRVLPVPGGPWRTARSVS